MTTPLSPESVDAYVAEAFPAAHALGLRCETLDSGTAVARWLYDPKGLRPGGYIPGTTQFALADVAMWFAVFSLKGLTPMAVTADFHITFLRPARDSDLLGRARFRRVGARRAYGEVELWVEGDPDHLVSHATGSYALPEVT